MTPKESASLSEKLKWLTIKECVALISGLTEHTVCQLEKQRKIKSILTSEGESGKILVNKANRVAYFSSNAV